MKLEDIVDKFVVIEGSGDEALIGFNIECFIEKIKEWAKGCVPEKTHNSKGVKEEWSLNSIEFCVGRNSCREEMLKNIEEQ